MVSLQKKHSSKEILFEQHSLGVSELALFSTLLQSQKKKQTEISNFEVKNHNIKDRTLNSEVRFLSAIFEMWESSFSKSWILNVKTSLNRSAWFREFKKIFLMHRPKRRIRWRRVGFSKSKFCFPDHHSFGLKKKNL